MIELGIQDIVYLLGKFTKDKLNKAQRKSKKYLESVYIRIEEEEGIPRFIFGTYEGDEFKIIDTAKINKYEIKGVIKK